MARSIRLAIAVAVLAALAVGAGVASAAPPPHAKKILSTRLVGISQPGQVLLGVTGGGRPWTLVRGDAKLFADGRLDLKVTGLVLGPGGANEGTNPIAMGRAIVVCNGSDAVMSGTVPFSPSGDARVKESLSLTSPCLAPVVFFGSAGGSWFAVSG
jgi:hypothetical protein